MKRPSTLVTRAVLPVGVSALLTASHLDPGQLAWIDAVLAHHRHQLRRCGVAVSVLALVTSVGQVLITFATGSSASSAGWPSCS